VASSPERSLRETKFFGGRLTPPPLLFGQKAGRRQRLTFNQGVRRGDPQGWANAIAGAMLAQLLGSMASPSIHSKTIDSNMCVLSRVPSWRTIKTIGGSRSVAIAGFFPFLGYIILLNRELFDAFRLITDVDSQHDLISADTFDRVRQIYFGLVWLSAGVILYRLLCPEEIKSFDSRYDFISREVSVTSPSRLRGIQQQLRCQSWESYFIPPNVEADVFEAEKAALDRTLVEALSFPDMDAKKSFETWLSDSRFEVYQLLNAYYDRRNFALGPIRTVAFVCYSVGYAMLAWPSLKTLAILLVTHS
jgi:hypothetical protein